MFEWNYCPSAHLPKIARIDQEFDNASIANIDAHIASECKRTDVAGMLKPGAKVALAVGSRGIGKIDSIVSALVSQLKEIGAHPFIVPAMGSHGGATAEGQRAVLESYNITEQTVGAPVRSSMEVVNLGEVEPGIPVFVDKIAATEADAIIPVARVKPHTVFRGPIESGLHKMLCIGLGKQHGAERLHACSVDRFSTLIPAEGQFIMKRLPVVFGLAIVENAFEMPLHIEIVKADDFLWREKELLLLAQDLMPRIPVNALDLLVIKEIGKNISGSGMDPNVTGRYCSTAAEDGPLILQRIVILDLSELTHGNATGIGMSDVVTRKAVQKIDFHATYMNSLTSSRLERPKIPMVAATDKDAVSIGIETCTNVDKSKIRVAFIENTLKLESFYASEGLLAELQAHKNVVSCGDLIDIPFDGKGDLALF